MEFRNGVVWLIIFSLSLSLVVQPFSSYHLNSSSTDQFQINDLIELETPNFQNILNKREVNLFFLGLDQSNFNPSSLLDSLPSTYTPIKIRESLNQPQLSNDQTYLINYSINILDTVDLSNFVSFANSIAHTDLSPIDVGDTLDLISYYPSELIEQYLNDNYSNDTTSIFFINTEPDVNHQEHLYYSGDLDKTTNIENMRHIAGGGNKTSTIWLDLSAISVSYRDTGIFAESGVNSTLVPPLSTYPLTDAGRIELTSDLSYYIETAVQLRILPSIRHSFLKFQSNLHLDLRVYLPDLVDPILNTDPVLSELEEQLHENYIFSNITINLTFKELSPGTLFGDILENSYSGTTNSYDPTELIETIQSNFDSLNFTYDEDTLTIPGFFFVLEGARTFDGLTSRVFYDETPSFIFHTTNVIEIDTYNQYSSVVTSPVLSSNSSISVIGSNSTRDRFQTSITNGGDQLDVIILNEFNYQNYLDNLPYQSIRSTSVSSSASFSFVLNQTSRIYWIFNSSTPNYQYSISNQGFGQYSYHPEINGLIGSFIGLSSPNLGYNSTGNELQLFQLWSQTNSISAGSLSFLDKQVVARNHLHDILETTKSEVLSYFNILSQNNSYLPPSLNMTYLSINTTLNDLNSLITSITWWNNLNQIKQTLDLLNSFLTEIKQIQYEQLTHSMTVSFNSTAVEQFELLLMVNNRVYRNQTFLVDTTIDMEEIGFAEYYLEISVKSKTYYSVSGYTWNLPSNPFVFVPGNVTQTRTIFPDGTPINNPDDGFFKLTYLWIVIPIIAIPILVRKYYYTN